MPKNIITFNNLAFAIIFFQLKINYIIIKNCHFQEEISLEKLIKETIVVCFRNLRIKDNNFNNRENIKFQLF